MRFHVWIAVPFLPCPPLKPSVTFRGLPLTLSHPAFHRHLLRVIIQRTGLCVNCAPPNIFPFTRLPTHSWMSLYLLSKPPPAVPCPGVFLHSQVSRLHLPGLNHPETRPGKQPPHVCQAAMQSADKPGTCRRDKVAFTLQGNQWE